MNAPTLWIEITELFGQFARSGHPTGISRVMVNLSDALAAEPGAFGRVQPIFWDPLARRPLMMADPGLGRLAAFFCKLRESYAKSGWELPAIHSGLRKGMMTAIPKPFRFRLFPYLNAVTHFLGWAKRMDVDVVPAAFSPNDCLFVPGSFWLDGYAPRMAAMARARRATVAAFVHDVFLLSHPEWLPGRHGEQFKRGSGAFLPLCAAIACNSNDTAAQLRRYVSLPESIQIRVCRLADGPAGSSAQALAPAVAEMLERKYVLFVSTLTPRKNHRLALAAWRNLRNVLADDTPLLVLVGNGAPDPMLAEALRRGESSRIVLLGGVDDGTLEALYANAWMTIYPSLGEGYGLPVAEALARGKICIATACAGLQEIAPGLVDVIDPHNPDDLAGRILFYASSPACVSEREKQVRSCYHRTSWMDTARAVRRLLEQAARTDSVP